MVPWIIHIYAYLGKRIAKGIAQGKKFKKKYLWNWEQGGAPFRKFNFEKEKQINIYTISGYLDTKNLGTSGDKTNWKKKGVCVGGGGTKCNWAHHNNYNVLWINTFQSCTVTLMVSLLQVFKQRVNGLLHKFTHPTSVTQYRSCLTQCSIPNCPPLGSPAVDFSMAENFPQWTLWAIKNVHQGTVWGGSPYVPPLTFQIIPHLKTSPTHPKKELSMCLCACMRKVCRNTACPNMVQQAAWLL